MRVCRIILWLLITAYAIALGLLVIGAFGLFGSPSGPLAGVYLVPLGVPWVLIGADIADEPGVWLLVAAPLPNILILWLLCRFIGSRSLSNLG